MFITSLIPLWISILIFVGFKIGDNICSTLHTNEKMSVLLLNIFKNNVLESILALLVIFITINSVCGINAFLKIQQKSVNKQSGRIMKAKKLRNLSSEFLLAYILPLIAFNFSVLCDVILFIVYFMFLAWLCVRNNNVYTNILLELKGYKIYECDIECNILNKTITYTDSLLISTQDLTLQIGNTIDYWDFDKDIYIDLWEKNI